MASQKPRRISVRNKGGRSKHAPEDAKREEGIRKPSHESGMVGAEGCLHKTQGVIAPRVEIPPVPPDTRESVMG